MGGNISFMATTSGRVDGWRSLRSCPHGAVSLGADNLIHGYVAILCPEAARSLHCGRPDGPQSGLGRDNARGAQLYQTSEGVLWLNPAGLLGVRREPGDPSNYERIDNALPVGRHACVGDGLA